MTIIWSILYHHVILSDIVSLDRQILAHLVLGGHSVALCYLIAVLL